MIKKTIAIIPARSGSKSVKDKNIILLNNKPLLAWSIESCLRSKMISNIYVSTDSAKYAKNAKDCKFNAIKFQKRTIDIVYDQKTLDTPRESLWGETTREQKLGLEFEKKEYDEIDKYCKELGMDWFASAWDVESLKFLENYNLKYNKK